MNKVKSDLIVSQWKAAPRFCMQERDKGGVLVLTRGEGERQ